MSEEFGPDFVTVTDEDGKEFVLEYVDTLEHNGQIYYAFFPTSEDENADDDEMGLIILKSLEENGEEILATPDSEDELNEVFDLFEQQLFEDEEDGE